LNEEEARQLVASIDTRHVMGLLEPHTRRRHDSLLRPSRRLPGSGRHLRYGLSRCQGLLQPGTPGLVPAPRERRPLPPGARPPQGGRVPGRPRASPASCALPSSAAPSGRRGSSPVEPWTRTTSGAWSSAELEGPGYRARSPATASGPPASPATWRTAKLSRWRPRSPATSPHARRSCTIAPATSSSWTRLRE
jgi:hypothetical protein